MKRIKIIFYATFLVPGLSVSSQLVTSDAVVNIAIVKPKPEISIEQFEAIYLEEFIPNFNKIYPSVRLNLLKKIQGNRMDEYVLFKVFESIEKRNQLWPEPGVSTDKAKECHKKMEETWKRLLQKAMKETYTEYFVLPFSSNTINVKSGNVVCVNEGEFNMEKSLNFEDLHLAMQKEFETAYSEDSIKIQYCLLKGDNGEREGKYTELMVIDSLEEYYKWNAEVEKKSKQPLKNLGEIREELFTYSNSIVYVVL